MRRDYRLYELGDDEFETLVSRLCIRWFGQGFTPFALGRDGGRDGWFSGTAEAFPSTALPLTGHVVVQTKHVNSPNRSCSDRDFLRILRAESVKITRLVKAGRCDHYVIVTNRACPAGAEEKLIPGLIALGLKSAHLIGLERISLALDDFDDIRRMLTNDRSHSQDMAELLAKTGAIMASLISDPAMRTLFDKTPAVALEREVRRLVGSAPDATADELAEAVRSFGEKYKELSDKLDALTFSDRRSGEKITEARTLLAAGELSAAREAWQEAIDLRSKAMQSQFHELADAYFNYGAASLLDSDWRAADIAMTKCADMLALNDPKAATGVRFHLATELHALWRRLSDLDPLRRAIELGETILAAADIETYGVRFVSKVVSSLLDWRTSLSRTQPTRDAYANLQLSVETSRQFLLVDCQCVDRAERMFHVFHVVSGLTRIGEHLSGRRSMTALIEATRILDDAELQPDRVAGSAIDTRIANLRGSAFKLLAERTSKKRSRRYFAEAITSFERAMDLEDEGTFNWCVAASNLGIVHWSCAYRDPDDRRALGHLETARRLHGAVLEKLDAGHDKAMFAWVSHNLAATLLHFAERSPLNQIGDVLKDGEHHILNALALYDAQAPTEQSIASTMILAGLHALGVFAVPAVYGLAQAHADIDRLSAYLPFLHKGSSLDQNLSGTIEELTLITRLAEFIADRQGNIAHRFQQESRGRMTEDMISLRHLVDRLGLSDCTLQSLPLDKAVG